MTATAEKEKEILAARFFAAYPPEMFLFGLVEAALGARPSPAAVNSLMNKLEQEDIKAELANACTEAILSTFDTEELSHLVEFFDSEAGRRAIPKLGAFSAAATPPVMRILGRMIAGTQ
jgi:hypothetical protein